jgi:hypothetical protein
VEVGGDGVPQIPARTRTDETTPVNAIAKALGQLGPSALDVADALAAAGVRGRRRDASFTNPVIRYLNRTLDIGRRMTIPVGGDRLLVESPDTTLEVPLPAAVKDFLDSFHTGLYPHLELT